LYILQHLLSLNYFNYVTASEEEPALHDRRYNLTCELEVNAPIPTHLVGFFRVVLDLVLLKL